jgi:HSP20 family protein
LWDLDDNETDDGFRSLRREIDRVMNDFSRGFPGPWLAQGSKGLRQWDPRLDVAETDGEFEITVELPGVDEKDVDVTLWGDVLTIKGEKKSETEDKKKDFHRIERSYGMFQRQMSIPFDVDPKDVDAKFKKGVLTVTLPKPPEAQAETRKVKIQAKD